MMQDSDFYAMLEVSVERLCCVLTPWLGMQQTSQTLESCVRSCFPWSYSCLTVSSAAWQCSHGREFDKMEALVNIGEAIKIVEDGHKLAKTNLISFCPSYSLFLLASTTIHIATFTSTAACTTCTNVPAQTYTHVLTWLHPLSDK